jgi:hypothetical protein
MTDTLTAMAKEEKIFKAEQDFLEKAMSKLTEEEYDAIAQKAWDSGYNSGRDGTVDTVVCILRGNASRMFLDKKDALATYTRGLIGEIERLKK